VGRHNKYQPKAHEAHSVLQQQLQAAVHKSDFKVTADTDQLSMAIPLWVGTIITSQRAVTPYGRGVKAGMVCVWVAGKTVRSPCYTRATSERFRDKRLIYKALYNSAVYFTFTLLYVYNCR